MTDCNTCRPKKGEQELSGKPIVLEMKRGRRRAAISYNSWNAFIATPTQTQEEAVSEAKSHIHRRNAIPACENIKHTSSTSLIFALPGDPHNMFCTLKTRVVYILGTACCAQIPTFSESEHERRNQKLGVPLQWRVSCCCAVSHGNTEETFGTRR